MDGSLTIRVDNHIKKLAQENAKALGLDISTVMRMLLNHLAAQSTLPEGLVEPNAQTLQAIYELENDINTSHYTSVDDLKKDLGW